MSYIEMYPVIGNAYHENVKIIKTIIHTLHG